MGSKWVSIHLKSYSSQTQQITFFWKKEKKKSKADGLPVPVGVCVKWGKIGEMVGEMWPAGDDLSGTGGLLMLPRLQSLMRPCWIGLDEN